MSKAYLRYDRDIWRKVAADEFGRLIISERNCAIWEKTANDYLPRIERLEDTNEKLQLERDNVIKLLEERNEDARELVRENEQLQRELSNEQSAKQEAFNSMDDTDDDNDKLRKAIEDALAMAEKGTGLTAIFELLREALK